MEWNVHNTLYNVHVANMKLMSGMVPLLNLVSIYDWLTRQWASSSINIHVATVNLCSQNFIFAILPWSAKIFYFAKIIIYELHTGNNFQQPYFRDLR